jgi:hypothetical protein
MTIHNPQPSTYRIRLYDGDYEVLTDRKVMAVLDFTAGPGLRATEGQLDALVQSLAYAAGARGPHTLNYHLVVEDWDTREKKCNWPAKTWAATT